jgi:hypothetical protein
MSSSGRPESGDSHVTVETPSPNRAARRANERRSRKVAAVGSGVALAAGTLGALAAVAPPAGADTILVTTTDDSVPGSLRDALANANDGDVIDLTGLSGTITLTGGQLDIEDAVTIMGPGPSTLSINGNGASRVFSMYDDLADGQTVTITGLTITNGNDAEGGGIFFNCAGNFAANLVIDNVAVTNNTVNGLGGGLYFDRCAPDGGGNFTITNSVISGNRSTDSGAGGLWFDEGGTLSITNTTISGNTTESDGGGGITFDDGASLVIVDSTIADNDAAASGGGLYLFDPTASVLIANSTFSGNHANNGYGGGIATYADLPVMLLQTTISGNTASGGGDGLYMGGYIQAPAAAGNGRQEERVQAAAVNSTVVATGTLIAGNADGTDDIATDSSSSLQTDHSVLGAVDPDIQVDDQGGNQFGVVDPGLEPLASNGGPTQTMALTATSVALNTGPETVPTFPDNEFDQRGPGFPRVALGRVDVGAYELQEPEQAPEIIEVTPRLAG